MTPRLARCMDREASDRIATVLFRFDACADGADLSSSRIAGNCTRSDREGSLAQRSVLSLHRPAAEDPEYLLYAPGVAGRWRCFEPKGAAGGARLDAEDQTLALARWLRLNVGSAGRALPSLARR
jgi:hypothetical protein